MCIEEAFSRFLRHKKIESRTCKTILNYKIVLKPFISFLGVQTLVSSLTLEQVEDYFLLLQQRNLSLATLANYIRHIKVFLHFIEKQYGLSFSYSEIVVPKFHPGTFYIYKPEEIKAIFNSVTIAESWIADRNRAVIALMLDSGLRQSEVSSLLWEWVDFKGGKIKVYGKGRKERFVPLGQMSGYYLEQYRKSCPFAGTPYVFSERRGGQLTNDTIKHFIHKMKQRLPFPFYSHLLRHNFATNWCLDQYRIHGVMDVYGLQAIMGHTDVKTTSRYLHFAKSLIAVENSVSHLDMVMPLPVS